MTRPGADDIPTMAGSDDGRAGVLIEDAPYGRPLLIAFGGVAGRLGMAPFEFFRLVSDLPCGKVFVRDIDQAWYQRGVDGLGGGIDDSAASLAQMIAARSPERVVMVGNSAGGYAALLFGHLIPDVDAILAFSPQTFIDRWHRAIHLDRRWRRPIATANRGRSPARYRDLLPILRSRTQDPPRVDIFASVSDRLDSLHARRVGTVPHITIRWCEGTDHSLIRSLRDRGELKPLLEAAIRPDPGSAARRAEPESGSGRRGPAQGGAPMDGA
jgi:pimeloyl-ACP methyl ester carboxylesterase